MLMFFIILIINIIKYNIIKSKVTTIFDDGP